MSDFFTNYPIRDHPGNAEQQLCQRAQLIDKKQHRMEHAAAGVKSPDKVSSNETCGQHDATGTTKPETLHLDRLVP
jgi:hypothetical protein